MVNHKCIYHADESAAELFFDTSTCGGRHTTKGDTDGKDTPILDVIITNIYCHVTSSLHPSITRITSFHVAVTTVGVINYKNRLLHEMKTNQDRWSRRQQTHLITHSSFNPFLVLINVLMSSTDRSVMSLP